MSATNRTDARRQAGSSRIRWVILIAVALLAATSAVTPAGAAEGFSDVDPGSSHRKAIEALDARGVFADTGCGVGLFCPGDPIERWVMAVWLIRVLGGEGATTGASRFADVDASEWWSPYAEELADRGITKGCKTGPLRYCPDQSVTRAQMAAFLVRAFNLEGTDAAAGFTDTEGTRHEANIDAVAAAGITKGCATEPLRYCPDQPVTRAQMAAFLHRALLKQEEQTPEPEPITISDDVPDVDLTDMTNGDTVNLRSLFTGDKAVLFWFWAEW